MKTINIKTHPLVNLSVKVTDEMIKDYKDCKRQAHIIGGGKDCEKCSWNNVLIYDNLYACCTGMEVLLEEGGASR